MYQLNPVTTVCWFRFGFKTEAETIGNMLDRKYNAVILGMVWYGFITINEKQSNIKIRCGGILTIIQKFVSFDFMHKTYSIIIMAIRGGVLKRGVPNKKDFFPKNQHTQKKLLNFEKWVNGEVSVLVSDLNQNTSFCFTLHTLCLWYFVVIHNCSAFR